MEINKIKRLVLILLMSFATIGAQAQLEQAVKKIFAGDSITGVHASMKQGSDSAYVANLQKTLETARLNEANMRMEMEQMKLQMAAADSVKYARQRQRIDSLRQFTKGIPVVADGDTLFYLYTKRGGYTPQQRAQMTGSAIEELGRRFNLRPDSVSVDHSDIVSDLMYGNKVLLSLTDQDALWEGVSRDSLANERRQNVVDKLHEMKAEHGIWRMAKRILYFVLVIVGQYFLFRLTNWLFRKLKVRILRLKDTKIKPVSIQGYELLDAQKQANLLVFLASVGRYILMGLQLLFTVPLIFIIFPQTEGLAYRLLGYIWNPIRGIFVGIIDYIPKLFTIIVIWYAVKYLVRFVLYLAREVEGGRLKINGFYPDWAMPTFHIIRFLLYAFMIAMIYPYLPGSNSGVFQGISVFVGLIVSLGSSTVIGNIIAGLVITYMRPFKIGDRIQLNDTTGNIIEKTPLVTRIRTPKNEVVTVPNSFVMSSHTVNYSTSAREYGLIIHSEVSIGYDIPWRKVNELLIDAALNTPGVVDDPRPFVLETSLSDWYPVYQVNAYIKEADKMPQIYSNLHQNIQDKFNEAGIEIMSPHYMAMRDGNETTIPKDDLRNTSPTDKTAQESKPK
ncbi:MULTISPECIES: mechanosensitive ion channel family protein [Bacteroides]|jgi:mechanosensitive ion channel family protein|uniref:Mechanosensitive ion channel family protein n=1 Tax=Bacteroides finegoldii TaxID=338188 RepID=A0A7J4YQV9_9BACE|nr:MULTISPECIES: mechanosensitive ion channel family protein [Bacteroides]EEX47340.1 transporter, small conductance mechanosensitive ion channel MscS family protein [Bacteroides finegoldii DSM 17565]KAA5218690.1 mechanosensitive ion channel family protein [Bacteroides finegoldii]KAA5222692.1 mechanosensitive ion channel family protein [Bacteroides finegoldii]KAA5227092.1 mechanosensitive ion channel family protein [Bacteroides finegoldii]KAA5231204.1 mechanosensitive ion channel family protein